jgi:hypothetical protein
MTPKARARAAMFDAPPLLSRAEAELRCAAAIADVTRDLGDQLRKKTEDYDDAEAENQNLRDTLTYALVFVPPKESDDLEKRLSKSIEEGGVTGTTAEDERQEVIVLLNQIVEHVEFLTHGGSVQTLANRQPSWFARLDYLLTEARQYGPQHPVARRVGGHPNVFAPVWEKLP